MKCEHFQEAVTTGGFLRRWQARRHATHCSCCAQVQMQLQQITEELMTIVPLTPSQRLSWLQASEGDLPVRAARSWVFRPAFGIGVVAAVGCGVMLFLLLRTPSEDPMPLPPASRSEMAQQMEGIHDMVVSLSRELDDLKRGADLLDARRDADALWRQLTKPSSQKEF